MLLIKVILLLHLNGMQNVPMTGYSVKQFYYGFLIISRLMAFSKKTSFIFYGLAAVCIALYAIFFLLKNHDWGGWLLLMFFISLAIAFRSSTFLKGLSFTLMILAVVSLAMYHPQYFKTVGGFTLSAMII